MERHIVLTSSSSSPLGRFNVLLLETQKCEGEGKEGESDKAELIPKTKVKGNWIELNIWVAVSNTSTTKQISQAIQTPNHINNVWPYII